MSTLKKYFSNRVFKNYKKPIDKKLIVVLSGGGISAESGIKTFRDSDGLWQNHDVKEVASPEGWKNTPELVLEFLKNCI